MSPRIELANRAQLLMMCRAPSSYRNTHISVDAASALAVLCFKKHMRHGCTVLRCARVGRVIVGRQKQIYEILLEAGHLRATGQFAATVDNMWRLHTQVQVAAAAAAFDAVTKQEMQNV
jgi:hypothetical protein